MRNIILAIIVLISLTTPAASTSVDVVPRIDKIHALDEFIVDINITPDTHIAGYQFNLEVTNADIISVTEGDFLKQYGYNTFFNKGTVNGNKLINHFSAVMGNIANQTSIPMRNGTTITVVFKAKDVSAVSDIKLSNVKLADRYGLSVPYILNNGSVTIHPKVDLNLDGAVDILDLVFVSQYFGEENSEADFDHSGIVDILDLVYVAMRIG
ncbi:MAG: dockerin type I domain-containing protein [Methanobacteriota archaeon]